MDEPEGRVPSTAGSKPVVSAVFILPRPIRVTPGALAVTGWEPFGPGAAVKLLPAVPTDGGAFFAKPDLPDVEDDDEALAARWVAPAEDGATELRGFGMLIRLEDERLLRPRPGAGPTPADALVDHAFQFVDHWADLVRTWIEVCTAQDLDADHPLPEAEVEGSGLTTWARRRPGSEAERRDRSRTWVHMRADQAASQVDWKIAVTLAGRLTSPPLEHVLMRDARSAYMRRQGRRMIIEAATATELALNQLLARHGLRPPRRSALGLAAAMKACAENRIDTGAREDQLNELRLARNEAAHEGSDPDRLRLFDHLDTAQRVVDVCVPLAAFARDALRRP